MMPLCVDCVRWLPLSDPPVCDAFHEGIPAAIINGEVNHRRPVSGDHGIRFKSI